eukprot:752938-Hanusia_phi.AAC.3
MISAKGRKDPECVKVVVRCRPMSRREVEDNRQQIVSMNVDAGEVTVRNPESDMKEAAKPFTFDQVFDSQCEQELVFETTAQPIVDSVLQGYNGTVFAYGQTGTGKTHTMEGLWDPQEMRGIIPRSFSRIFSKIDDTHDQNFLVRASFLEIYNEEVRDLLAKDPKNKLDLKEDNDRGVYVKDLTSYVVKGVTEMENVLLAGKKNRSVGATLMNQDSSRSHSIFTIVIESSAEGSDGSRHIRAGKLNLVDLAGSERQSKTGATGDRLKEPRTGHEDQLVAVCPGQRDLRTRRREIASHSLPRLEADAAPSRFPRRQHQDRHGGQHRACGLQLRRDHLHPPIRQQGEEHQEQAQDQRRPQGHHAPRVPGTSLRRELRRVTDTLAGGDCEAEGDAGVPTARPGGPRTAGGAQEDFSCVWLTAVLSVHRAGDGQADVKQAAGEHPPRAGGAEASAASGLSCAGVREDDAAMQAEDVREEEKDRAEEEIRKKVSLQLAPSCLVTCSGRSKRSPRRGTREKCWLRR